MLEGEGEYRYSVTTLGGGLGKGLSQIVEGRVDLGARTCLEREGC